MLFKTVEREKKEATLCARRPCDTNLVCLSRNNIRSRIYLRKEEEGKKKFLRRRGPLWLAINIRAWRKWSFVFLGGGGRGGENLPLSPVSLFGCCTLVGRKDEERWGGEYSNADAMVLSVLSLCFFLSGLWRTKNAVLQRLPWRHTNDQAFVNVLFRFHYVFFWGDKFTLSKLWHEHNWPENTALCARLKYMCTVLMAQ